MPHSLGYREALADHAHVPSVEMFAGCGQDAPLLTIAIPTCRRPDLLAEAVASALDQDFAQPYEIVVVDDDPQSTGHEQLRARLPRIASANFRYLRNAAGLGMFGNHNRCISSARGAWVTILHDDDLLDPNFATEMMRVLGAGTLRGLVCRKRMRDDRRTPYTEPWWRHALRAALKFYRFGTAATRPITARKLFWGNAVGNPVGFICRTEDAVRIGGFYPEEHPSADYFFYARFAERHGLHEYRRKLVSIRIAANSLLHRDAQLASLRRGYELQGILAGSALPRVWGRITPLLMTRQAANTVLLYRSDLTKSEVEAALGIALARDRPLLLYALRTILRGW